VFYSTCVEKKIKPDCFKAEGRRKRNSPKQSSSPQVPPHWEGCVSPESVGSQASAETNSLLDRIYFFILNYAVI
jgi:hypothetical protein